MISVNDYNMMTKPMLVALVQEQAKQIDSVTEELEEKSNALKDALELIAVYEENINSLKLTIFGAKSEKRPPVKDILPDNTFNDAEAIADPEAPEASIEEVTKPRNRGRKQKGKREEKLRDLPVVEVMHDLPEGQCTCPECGGSIRCLGKDVRDEIVHIPAKTYIRRHVTPKYICNNCDKNSDKATIIKADSPKPVIPNSGLASASIISSIIFNKFFMGLPLYRQEKECKLNEIPISRQNMANWMIYSAVKYFKPLYDIMHEELLDSFSIHCDETIVKVLKELLRKNERTKNSKSYFWLFQTGQSEPHKIILFKYSHSREHEVPEEFLKGFNSYAHVDGYKAYRSIDSTITWVGCWSHCKRKFMDVYKLIPEECRNQKPLTLCEVGLNYIDELFKIERVNKELSYEELFKVRQDKSLKIIDEFFTWVDDNLPIVTSKSKIGIALTYAHNQEASLRKYILDGRLEMSNNRAERSVRPVTIGRKNWLFCDTANGAEASSILYSIVLTAVENSLDPFKYTELVLNELAQITPSKFTPDILKQYLPYSDYIISKCKVDLSIPGNTDNL